MSEFKFDIPELSSILSEIKELKKEVSELKEKIGPEKKSHRMINSKQVCELLQISMKKLYHLELSGKICPHKIGGKGKRIYSEKEIHKYLDQVLAEKKFN